MRKFVENAYDALLPNPEVLWQRGGREMQSFEIEPGRSVEAPIFDLEITHFEEMSVDTIDDKKGKPIGRVIDIHAGVNNGTDRAIRLWKLDEHAKNSSGLLSSDGTALGMTINGVSESYALDTVRTNRLDHLQIGAEHSGTSMPVMLSAVQILKMIQVACHSSKVSLARTAQEEALITQHVIDRYHEPDAVIKSGASRAGMLAPAEAFYAEHIYEHSIAALDIKALCGYEKMTPAQVVHWLRTELVGGSAVVAAMLAEGEAEDLRDTTSLDAPFLLGAFMGTTPSLMAGELAVNMNWLRRDIPGQVLSYGKDELSSKDGMEQWKAWRNMNRKEIPNGIHAHMLRRRAYEARVIRVGKMSEMYDYYGDLRLMDTDDKAYVYGAHSAIVQDAHMNSDAA